MIRKLIQTHLESAGSNVTVVADGQHARVKIEEHAGIARLEGAGNRQFTPDNLKKGQSVGDNMQISKPSIHQISKYASQVLRERARGAAPSVAAAVGASV